MRDPIPYRKGALRELCNYQSKYPFITFEKHFAPSNGDSPIIIQCGNSQIYCGTRHFLRKTAFDEPFYSGNITKTFSMPSKVFEDLKIFEELTAAEEKVESLKEAPGCLRLEQNVQYLRVGEVDFLQFFSAHLQSIWEVFPVSRMKFQYDKYPDLLHRFASNSQLSSNLCKLLGIYMESFIDGFEMWGLCGVPIYDLQIITVSFDIWPGILKGYIKLFSCVCKKSIRFLNLNGYLPTDYLEVICVLERVMQYLFSGNPKKIGRDTETDVLVWRQIEEKNFPRLHSNYFIYSKNGWKLHADNCRHEYWCFSSFLSTGTPRKVLHTLESSINRPFRIFAKEFFNALLLSIDNELESALHLKKNERRFSEQTYLDLKTLKQLKSCKKISLEAWIATLVTIIRNPSFKRISPPSFGYVCTFIRNKKRLESDNSHNRLSNFLLQDFESLNPFWLPYINRNGFRMDMICLIESSDKAIVEILDITETRLDFYDISFIPLILKRFQESLLYRNHQHKLFPLLMKIQSSRVVIDVNFRVFFFKMLFHAISLLKNPSSKMEKLVKQFSVKLAPLILLYDIIFLKLDVIDLYRRLKNANTAPFKDYISTSTLDKLNVCTDCNSWTTIKIKKNLAYQWSNIEKMIASGDSENALRVLCLEWDHKKKTDIVTLNSILQFIKTECSL
jgi:hypothetical protein